MAISACSEVFHTSPAGFSDSGCVNIILVVFSTPRKVLRDLTPAPTLVILYLRRNMGVALRMMRVAKSADSRNRDEGKSLGQRMKTSRIYSYWSRQGKKLRQAFLKKAG